MTRQAEVLGYWGKILNNQSRWSLYSQVTLFNWNNLCLFHGKMLHWPNKNQLAVTADFILDIWYKLCCEKDSDWSRCAIIGILPSEHTVW